MALWNKLGSRGRVLDRRGAPAAVGGLGIAGVVVVLLMQLLGGSNIDVTDVLNQIQTTQIQNQQLDTSQFEGEDNYEVFVSTVLGSNNDMWSTVFSQNNKVYEEPQLVLFRGVTSSACGGATSEVGPHYCLLDDTIYLDETFFDALKNYLGGSSGDVAQAYVIAHEVGHHIQNKLGIMEDVQSNGSRQDSINLELQADCFAGLWAHSIRDRGVFEQGEIQEAIDAAAAVGDDRIQKKTTGRINPETWTHGSSEERVRWFNIGFETGQVSACNTFQ